MDVYNRAKKGAIDIKNTHGYIQNTDAEKSLFYEKVLDLKSFSQNLGLFSWFFILRIHFFQDFFSCDLIS